MASIQSFKSNPQFIDHGSCEIKDYDQPVHVGLKIGVNFNNKRKDGKYGLNLQLKYNQRTQIDGTQKIIGLLQDSYFLLVLDKEVSIDIIKYDHAMMFLPLVREAVDQLEEHALNNNCSKVEINSFSDTDLISALLKSEPQYAELI